MQPNFLSGLPLLLLELRNLPDWKEITVAYPDEGAWKRFHWQLRDFPEVICTKARPRVNGTRLHPGVLRCATERDGAVAMQVRDGEKRVVQLKEGVCQGRHVVIVDDLVQTGGTLIECQKARPRSIDSAAPQRMPKHPGPVM